MIDNNLKDRLQVSEDFLSKITKRFEGDWLGKANCQTMRGPSLKKSNEALGDTPTLELVIYLIENYPNVMMGRVLLHIADAISEDPVQNIFAIASKSLGLDHGTLSFTSKVRLLKVCDKALAHFTIYPKKAIRDIRLLSAELKLKARIKESEVPFLGLIEGDIRGPIKRAINIAQTSIPGVDNYVAAMKRHPALLCLRITRKINAGMGQNAINDVWPHVSEAIEVNSIANVHDRVKIWSAFREAIITLGLEPSARTHGQNYMKDEFLRQTGIPAAYIRHLADGMLNFAKENGMPNESNDDDIREWQKALCETDELHVQTVIKAVSLDTKGYFASRFISIKTHGLPQNPTDLDKALFDELQGTNPISASRIPRIAFDGHTLGIVLPKSGNVIYTMTIDDGTPTDYDTANARARYCCLMAERPKNVCISWGIEGDDNAYSKSFDLWNEGDNCILIFDDQNHLTDRAVLNQSDPVELPPGDYKFLSHFRPSNDDLEVTVIGDEFPIYCYAVSLSCGKQINITRGPAHIQIVTESLPYLSIESPQLYSKDGQDVFYGELNVHAHIPDELFQPHITTHITFEIQDEGHRVFKSGRVELHGEPINQVFRMTDLAENFGYGLSRIQLRVIDQIGNRLRTNNLRFWYWGGLREVSAALQFRCDVLPENLDRNRCINANVVEGLNLIEPATQDAELLMMAFRVGNRAKFFEWGLPNYFFLQKREIRDGHEIVTPIKLHSQVAVNETERVHYTITSSQSGEFRLGEWSERFKPRRNSTRQFSSSFLSGLAIGQDDWLRFVTDQGNEIRLLRIVKPLYADGLHTSINGAQEVLVHIQMLRPLDSVDVHLSETLSGRSIELVLGINRDNAQNFEYGRAWLAQDVHNSLTLRLDLNALPTGAWIMTFVGHIGREADLIRNQRKDVYALGLVRNQYGFIDTDGPIRQFLEAQPRYTNAESMGILRRANSLLLRCYEIQSWRSLRWLDDIWRRHLLRFRAVIGPHLTDLIDLAVARPPADASASWMLQTVAGALVPELYAQPAYEYNRVNIKDHPVSKALRAIYQLQEESFVNLIQESKFHPAVYVGCQNRGETDGPPREFQFSAYAEALSTMAGDETASFLGPAHYLQSIQSIEISYRNGLAGNEIRRGQCIMFCQRISRQFIFVPDTVDLSPHIDPWPVREFDNEEKEQAHANLMNFCHVLSLLAFHCRSETKNPGSLKRFTTHLTQDLPPDQRLEAHLSYLLQVGDAIFAYYLLLWEFALRAGFRK